MRSPIPWLVLACLVVAGAVFALYPQFDLAVAGLFFDKANGFVGGNDATIISLRNLNSAVDIVICAAMLLAIVVKLVQPARPMLIRGRTIIFLTVTLILAPVVMANVVFKAHSGRPRPYQVTEFGAPHKFMPWWDPRGDCDHNCSFLSGEVSSAAWTLAPAVMVPPPWRAVAVAASLAFTAAIAFVRISQGGHFLSDTIFAFLLTVLILWATYDVIFRRLRDRLTEAKIERALERCSEALRRRLGRQPQSNG